MIVESPAKARTIEGYLGKGYTVASSIGHIRDLPNRASDVPKEQRAKYGTMGVAIDEDFEPLYLVDEDKKKTVDGAEEAAEGAPTSCCSRRTKTARARRSPGTCSRS